MKTYKELEKRILEETPEKFKENVKSAIEYAKENSKKKMRYNGDPLISHLLNIGCLTTENNLDTNSIIAGILHESILDQKESKYILDNFGSDVLNILIRINAIKKCTDTLETPEDITIKYILNSSNDLRPVIIKILDTLEDMRTIEKVPEEKKKIALSKALNIYSILAEYLHLEKVKKEIEENAFREYLPIEHESIYKKMQENRIDNLLLEKYKNLIYKTIKDVKSKKRIEGRIKGHYSIYKKLKKYEKEWIDPNINRVDDIIAFRIITDSEESCFLILEKLMDNSEINYNLLDDYISNPKPNGYKAIQSPIKFSSVSDIYIEVQILTEEMHYQNTYGRASHIAYKASKSRYANPTSKYDWVEDIQKQMEKNKKEKQKKRDLPIECHIFEEEVLALTPKGKILALNKGDTVLDFAFKLHTQIGNSAVSAEVNGKAAKLSYILETGDIVEIKTDKSKKKQNDDALTYVHSLSSKFKIRKELSKKNIK